MTGWNHPFRIVFVDFRSASTHPLPVQSAFEHQREIDYSTDTRTSDYQDRTIRSNRLRRRPLCLALSQRSNSALALYLFHAIETCEEEPQEALDRSSPILD